VVGGKVADNLTILSWKKFMNEDAKVEAEEKVGKVLGECQQKRVLRHDQSFFSCLAQFAISYLKWEQWAERRRSDELSGYLSLVLEIAEVFRFMGTAKDCF
jgi:hypothetical protein